MSTAVQLCFFVSLNFVNVEIVSGIIGANVKGASVARQRVQKRVGGMHPMHPIHVATCLHTWRLRIYYLLVAWPRQLPASERHSAKGQSALPPTPPPFPLSLSISVSPTVVFLLFPFCYLCECWLAPVHIEWLIAFWCTLKIAFLW